MRVINLNESGIKLISSLREQIYVPLDDLKSFVKKKYTLHDGVLKFNDNALKLSESDIEELPNIIRYIKQRFINEDI